MSEYLIKTIKLPTYINSGDHLCEEDWLYVNPDEIHTINILGKEFKDSSIFEPVKHGRWVESWGGVWHSCSVCSRIPPFNAKGEDLLTDYCPNCGAKMDLDEVEE